MRNKAGALFLFLVTVIFSGCRTAPQLCFRQMCYALDVVSDPASRERGLMFRDQLPSKTGMLFVFDHEDIYPFWMKNVKFPIDILWLDADKCVVDIAANVPACMAGTCPVYTPTAKARYVLEIPAGDAEKNGIKAGDYFLGK
ncbi:MAG: DUF192 domain-containing protein [Candidatus Omnitrophota bacterium]